MADPQVNFFKSTLVGTYSDSDTSFTIATGDGALLPDPSVDGAFNLTIFEGLQVTGSTSFEIVRVTARSGDVLTVTRGQESTTPLTIGSAVHSILMSATKKTFDDINTAIENVDLTSLTGVEELTFDSTGDEEFGLPAGTTAQRPASPSAGYMRYNTETAKLEVYSGGVWGLVSLENVRAMEVAQLSVTANDAVAEKVINVEYLVVAGGGGGASGVGGGGGAGGYRSSVSGESSGGGASAESVFVANLDTSYTVTVGGGGAGGTDSSRPGVNGSNSVFSTITSTGGGGGAGIGSGFTGGSGGGGTVRNSAGGSGTANQGFDGGDALTTGSTDRAGGGGGGAGAVGQDAPSNDSGGDGGDGVSSSITGSAVFRAGGGGGGIDDDATDIGLGGNGGGGDGNYNGAGVSGTTNTGGGGGGGGFVSGDATKNKDGGAGGSGVVILRYPSALSITIGAGLTGTESTDGSEKYAVITAGTGNVSWT